MHMHCISRAYWTRDTDLIFQHFSTCKLYSCTGLSLYWFFVLFTYLFIHMKTWKNIESSSTQVSFFVNSQSIWQTRWLIHQSPLKVSKRNCNTEVNYWFWIRLRKLCFIAVWVSNKDFEKNCFSCIFYVSTALPGQSIWIVTLLTIKLKVNKNMASRKRCDKITYEKVDVMVYNQKNQVKITCGQTDD